MEIEKLKAEVYDHVRICEQHQQEIQKHQEAIQKINQQINQLEQQPAEPAPEGQEG